MSSLLLLILGIENLNKYETGSKAKKVPLIVFLFVLGSAREGLKNNLVENSTTGPPLLAKNDLNVMK